MSDRDLAPALPREVGAVRRDVPVIVARLTAALGPPLTGTERIDGRYERVWRWACPACGIGEDDPSRWPLLLCGAGWFCCDGSACHPEMIAAAVALRELPVVAG